MNSFPQRRATDDGQEQCTRRKQRPVFAKNSQKSAWHE